MVGVERKRTSSWVQEFKLNRIVSVAHLIIKREDLKVGLQVSPNFVVVRHLWTNEKRLQNLVIEQLDVDQFRDVTLYKYSTIIWYI
jgi:hypothetical protein